MSTFQHRASQELKQRLRRELLWLRLRLFGRALLLSGVGVGLLLLVAVLSRDGWTHGGPAAARVLVGLMVGIVGWNLYFELWRPLRRVANLKGFSRALESHGEYRNLLEAATQFTSRRKEDPVLRGSSPELVEEVLRRAHEAVRSAQLVPRIPLAGTLFHVPAAAVLLLLWLVVGLSAPQAVERTFADLADPDRLERTPPEEGLYVRSGDLRVPVGESVELRARDFIGGDEPVVVEINRTGDFWQQNDVSARPGPRTPPEYFDLQMRLDDVEDPFRYRFRKGALTTPAYEVAIRQRPVLSQLRLEIHPPAYTGRPVEERLDPSGAVTVLEGTEVVLEGRASSELSSARRQVVEGEAVDLEVDGRRFTDRLRVERDLRFQLELVDREGLDSESSTLYGFVAQPDDPPTVEITEPGEDRHLDRGLKVGVAGLAADDLGLHRLDLLYRLEGNESWTTVPLYAHADSVENAEEIVDLQREATEREVGVAFTWDLGGLELLPGDAVLYALEATDNDGLDGPNVTRSRVYRLRLPTIAEVFEIDREQRQEETQDLRALQKEGRELAEDLERLERELKKNPEPDWAKQKEIEEVLERQKELREKLESSAEGMRQQLENFERENAGRLETLEKMETVQELLEELKDDESLQAYLDAMRDAMDQLSPQDVQRQMQDALTDQEDFNRRLDRTIELLRQLERERAMSDLTEEVSDHLQRQQELAERTDPQPGEESEEGQESPSSEESESSPESESESSDESSDSSQEPQDPQSEPSPDSESDSQSPSDEPSDEEIARAQEQLAEEARELEKRLQEQLDQLQQEMEQEGGDPVSEEMKKALEKALENMDQSGKPSEPMDDAQKEIQEGQRGEARESQEEALARLLYLYEALSQGMQGMQQASGKAAFEKLQQTAFDLLDLSYGEEEVVDALRDGIRGQQMRPVARQHARVTRGATRLSEELHDLAQKNFRISERLLGEMRNLVAILEDGVEELRLSRARRSRDTAIEGMGAMNRIVINLLTAARNAQGMGGGSGQPNTSQQMRQMAEEQSRLNGMTQQLRERMQQGLTPQERQQLSEMHARQQALRQQLESLREEIEDERRILGDLEDLGRSMEEVEDDLGAGRITEDTERQQDRILSRLLDAERSVRERDFAKRREARGAEELFRPQVGAQLPTDEDGEEGRLRRWMAPEVAPRDYRDEVRLYFRSLQDRLQSGTGERE